ncbi:ankyrin repeat domain-containing protein [Amycolatopsis regifaucium]|uniref:Ankryin n=1 Tax=Amycolatopsis regifaucium TaxID=546365 RepID=A0A154MAC8_9PSEU|nr:ankyrin repeat domain-containing protein [Amycolatopsis regifaucium]KZB81512.1 ankryin [Amycolatopsis regifaucium]OKA06919.1 ankryin [Amycolatopsis regifaucium]SFH29643.1 Ankyrin repeat-containing protein [Amycolatopsis regifaucium]
MTSPAELAFDKAHELIDARDLDGLARLIGDLPTLVHAHGKNGNDLLGMATATCDERLCRLLLEHGADPAAANVHGWTALHQAGYAGLPPLVTMLLDAGAPVDVSARGDGGTPLVVALFWGHREAAEVLAARDPSPGNLRVAAGLGRADLLDSLIAPYGTLAPAAGAHREFYRPHSGFPDWRPSDDPAEIVDEALSWAARNDRSDAVRTLVARGAEVDAEVHRGTALAWAAAQGKAEVIGTLAELGASVNHQGTFGGLSHGAGVTALHLAVQGGHVAAVRALLAAGADPSLEDSLYSSSAVGWAEHFGQAEILSVLRAA